MKNSLSVFSIIITAAILLPAAVQAGSGLEKGQGKALGYKHKERVALYYERLAVGRALIEVQAGNWPTIMPYYAEDIEYHDPIVDIFNKADMTEFLARLFTSSSNLITIVEDETCVNGVYMASWTMTGNFDTVPYTAKGMSTRRSPASVRSATTG